MKSWFLVTSKGEKPFKWSSRDRTPAAWTTSKQPCLRAKASFIDIAKFWLKSQLSQKKLRHHKWIKLTSFTASLKGNADLEQGWEGNERYSMHYSARVGSSEGKLWLNKRPIRTWRTRRHDVNPVKVARQDGKLGLLLKKLASSKKRRLQKLVHVDVLDHLRGRLVLGPIFFGTFEISSKIFTWKLCFKILFN